MPALLLIGIASETYTLWSFIDAISKERKSRPNDEANPNEPEAPVHIDRWRR